MGRSRRVVYEGARYHVIQRGHNKNFIFKDPQDKLYFLRSVKEAGKRFDFSVLSYVLMNNHYHMILETGLIQIGVVMQFINARYARYYNSRYNLVGTVYGGRYTGVLITNILQLQYILGYIAYNPVRARLVRNLEDYHWSSYFDLKNNQRSIVNENKLAECYADDPKKGLAAYFTHIEMFTQQLHTKEAALLLGKANAGELLGEILENLPISAQNRHLLQIGIINIITRPCRNTFIKEAYSQGLGLEDIAGYINTSYETVRRVAHSQEQSSPPSS